MKRSGALSSAFVLLLIWAWLAWSLGTWLGVNSGLLWYLRAGLWLIGAAGFVGYLVLSASEDEPAQPIGFGNPLKEIDSAFVTASKVVAAAKGVRHLNSLPVIFLIGDSDAARSTSLARSGLAPELLAQNRTLSIWYARHTIFVDANTTVTADPATRRKLFKKFAPLRTGRRESPARYVVLAVDFEIFLKGGAISGNARQYQSVLTDIAYHSKCSCPVYVLFTRADRIPNFPEFVENLSDDESAEVLGVALPVLLRADSNFYKMEQGDQLASAFKSILNALSERRTLYLAREQSAAKLANIYEFPREFSKLRPLMVQFLLDICKPGPPDTATSFLRGFYFTGERETGSASVRQPVYIQRLFSDVFIADRVGSPAAPRNAPGGIALKVALGAIAFVAFLALGWLTVSYGQNSALLSDVLEASRPAGPDSLERLSHLRELLTRVDRYTTVGPPWDYRAMLFQGNAIRQPLQSVYFAMFHRILLDPAEQGIMKICTNPRASEAHGYGQVYDALKAYLITTLHPEKSTPAFLAPVLLRHWEGTRVTGAERENLARLNFVYYAEQLRLYDPFRHSQRTDETAITNARAYLNSYSPEERIYRSMLEDAGAKQKPIVFNEDVPGSSETIANLFRVQPSFTKNGYAAFQAELANLDRYAGAEDWVLGKDPLNSGDKRKLAESIAARFDSDFIEAWTGYLSATTLTKFGNLAETASKLRILGSTDSPLLADLCLASENVAIADEDVKAAFQPLLLALPPGCTHQLVSGSVALYAGTLTTLANALTTVGPKPTADEIRMAVGMTHIAENAAKQLTQGFKPDPDTNSKVMKTTTQLLREPIVRAQAVIGPPPR